MRKYPIFVAILCMTAGCVSQQGRFIGAEIDLRDEKQIQAGKFEAYVPYSHDGVNVPDLAKKEEFQAEVWWQQILDALKVIKGRLRIAVVEWEK
jgi:hypothetical protein